MAVARSWWSVPRSSPPLGSASSGPRTRSGAVWSATSMTAPSSTWSRWLSACGWHTRSSVAHPSVPLGCSASRRWRRRSPSRHSRHCPEASIPRQLADEGLGAALRSAVAGSAVPVSVDTHGLVRLPATVEAALYFCCMEAVQNAAKHSGGDAVSVRASEDSDRWWLTITDNGTGFDPARADAASGTGLANMRDRLDAVGGTVDVASRELVGDHGDRGGAPEPSGPRSRARVACRRGGLTCAPGSPGASSA